MRDNLIYYGIPEQRDEICEERVKALIKETLGITNDIAFDRVHMLGSSGAKKPRPIVAKFHNHKQREEVRQKAYTERETLKPFGYSVGVQFPKEIREKRKLLYPVMKREERRGKSVRLVNDRLYINNVLYDPENDPEPIV